VFFVPFVVSNLREEEFWLFHHYEMKILSAVIAVALVILVAVFLIRGRVTGTRHLTADEETMGGLVREVYGDRITSETVDFRGADAVLRVTLTDEKLESLEINLSTLARKHREQGLSLPVIKKSLQF